MIKPLFSAFSGGFLRFSEHPASFEEKFSYFV